jgi:ubiquinone/menaquinone biosynthesis C-methylase UbiE
MGSGIFEDEACVEQPFKKDLSHITWDEVYARQTRRAALVPAWMDALRLKAGDRILDVGSGPGYVSLVFAERVGPQGMVFAVDRSREALAYLERLQSGRGVAQITRLLADAAALDGAALYVDAAAVTMVLHHADDPGGILRAVQRLLPPGAPCVIAEYHPDGPGDQGPPLEVRIAPDTVCAWCAAAGLAVQGVTRQSPEHYMIATERLVSLEHG